MGKTKSKALRKVAKTVNNEGVRFNKDFEKNKKILEGLKLSKKLRNQMAGLMARTKKQQIAQLEKEKQANKQKVSQWEGQANETGGVVAKTFKLSFSTNFIL